MSAATQSAAVNATSAVIASCEGSGVPLSVTAGSSLLNAVSVVGSQSSGSDSSGLVSIVGRLGTSVATGQVLGSPPIVIESSAVQVSRRVSLCA